MRGKVAKLLRRYATAAKIRNKDLKRMWRGLTSRERHFQRKAMESQLEEARKK